MGIETSHHRDTPQNARNQGGFGFPQTPNILAGVLFVKWELDNAGMADSRKNFIY
jgi:hypothetical protein